MTKETSMPLARGLAALRLFACLLCLATPGPARAAGAPLAAVHSVSAAPAAEEKEESCGRGKATKEFGWKVVDFGVSTLKYLIGLFIIPVGFFLVVVGAMLQLVESVAC
jgi:hypothetical protein